MPREHQLSDLVTMDTLVVLVRGKQIHHWVSRNYQRTCFVFLRVNNKERFQLDEDVFDNTSIQYV